MNPQQPDEYPQAPVEPIPPQQPNVPPEAPVAPVQPSVSEPAASVAPEPVVAGPAPAFEAQPAVPPVPEVQPVVRPTVEQQPFGAQPAAPTQPVVPNSFTPPQQPPVSGSPAPLGFGTGPAPVTAQAPKFNNKLIGLIAAVVGGLLVIGLGVWLVLTFVTGSIALETYEGKGYSILTPKDYEKNESSTSVTFKEPDEDTDQQSQVAVSSYSIKSTLEYTTKDKLIEMYDKTLDEKSMTDSTFSSDSKIENFKKETVEYQGFDARKISFDVKEDGKRVGEGHLLIVFGDDTFYMVMVAAHASDPALAKSADKILNSLKIEE